ncbi:Xylulose kinase [Actinomycetales bacterium JB111]|nr:Xylulose kinase [Actinomycetales bacterium JB111]
MQYVIGIDTGTTGVKAKIYDLEGRIHGESYREYGCEYPRPGWIDQDITMLDRANDQVLSEVIARSPVDPADIVSIAVSTQRALHLYLDAEGNILRDGKGISWQDSRCEEQVQWIRETLGDRFYDLTGLPPSTVWVAPEILWVQRHEPDVYARTAKIVTTQEYFLHRLGASDAWRVDYSNGSLFGLMNIETFEWDDELLDAFGIDVGLLPELVPSGVAVGSVDEAAAARTGLRAGTPIVTGGGDQQCAAVGAGVIAEGLAEVTLGTAGVSIAHLDSPRFDPDRKIACSASAIAGERRWISEGLQAAAASSYRWYRDTIGYIGREVENLGGANAYDVLNEMVLNTAPGSSGLLFMPYLAGSVAPNFDSQARGAFLGLTISHDTGTMARSVMEGVAFETRDILEAFTRMGSELREIRLSGGATKSEAWCQIQTDVYKRPTVALEEGECAVLGSAILAAVGAGAFDTMADAVAAMVRVKRTFEPDASNGDVYDAGFRAFRASYEALSGGGAYAALADYQNR